ncbi:MAG: glycosyltransferase family 9 protein [Bacteroidia bacterium]|nr:glycosyltransferase family 9 protein [Bacteroidia bacterium]
MSGVELHFVTKQAFKPVLASNPYIDKLHCFKSDVEELYQELQNEKFDVVIDLHHNLRSLRLKRKLKVKSYSFRKLNINKFLAVNFKWLSVLPSKHIVDRYLETVKELGVKNDGTGLDYFLDEKDKVDSAALYFNNTKTKFIALVIGGSYFTKKIPQNKLLEIAKNSQLPILLLGGPEDKAEGDELVKQEPKLINTCGTLSINQSASIVQQAEWVISSDTGLMHIASAFHKKIISVWGNTIPQFGMDPYKPDVHNKMLQVTDLKCRPCSKLGYKKCPLGHFKCMNEIDYSFVKELE